MNFYDINLILIKVSGTKELLSAGKNDSILVRIYHKYIPNIVPATGTSTTKDLVIISEIIRHYEPIIHVPLPIQVEVENQLSLI
ncbi:hypothetical protein KHQ81_06105 [Mycoplasmatota bacterium]|nr:hypothetical protein KHQ81_06105 [Mycoplasmatota bacterium]